MILHTDAGILGYVDGAIGHAMRYMETGNDVMLRHTLTDLSARFADYKDAQLTPVSQCLHKLEQEHDANTDTADNIG